MIIIDTQYFLNTYNKTKLSSHLWSCGLHVGKPLAAGKKTNLKRETETESLPTWQLIGKNMQIFPLKPDSFSLCTF